MTLRKILIFLIVVFHAYSSAPMPLHAQETRSSWVQAVIGEELIPPGCREGRQESSRDCGIAQILQTAVNITRLILGVMGSIALLMFAYGGIYFIIAAGNQNKVEKGKTILTNAVIGIVLILTSWTIINFLVIALTKGSGGLGGPAVIFEDKPIEKPPTR